MIPGAVSQRITILGKVQGVGFRPHVYKLAKKNLLTGFVKNSGSGLSIQVSGNKVSVDRFLQELQENQPSISNIESVESEIIPYEYYTDFIIEKSDENHSNALTFPQDESICQDCLVELFNTHDRRFLYPFNSCCVCGPRYTIQLKPPFDRINTTMAKFTMCHTCRNEYENPEGRRFHAQTISCTDCGPKIYDMKEQTKDLGNEEIINLVVKKIVNGDVGAIKGLGGFHFICRADDPSAVIKVRKLKNRKKKPLAILVDRNIFANNIKNLPYSIRKKINSVSPVTILPNLNNLQICEEVLYTIEDVGMIPPYTGLLEILMRKTNLPLILTSANDSGDPLLYEEIKIIEKYGSELSFILSNNRDIQNPIDDSVVKIHNNGYILVRAGRGFYPKTKEFVCNQTKNVLGIGADLKSNFSLSQNHSIYLSPYIGDLENPRVQTEFLKRIERILKIDQIKSGILISDIHEGYHSVKIGGEMAKKLNFEELRVQHHHAHIVSCMGDHKLDEPVIGIVLDGTGLGIDQNVWGGEVFIADCINFVRAGSIQNFYLIGGDLAAKETYRSGLSLIIKYGVEALLPEVYGKILPEEKIEKYVSFVKSEKFGIHSSSCGRLFDGVASILGLCQENEFESQAPILLEQEARKFKQEEKNLNLYEIIENNSFQEKQKSGYGNSRTPFKELSLKKYFMYLLENKEAGVSEKAYYFHKTLIEGFSEIVKQLSIETGIQKVVLSGGCFLNSILSEYFQENLAEMGLDPYVHNSIPTDDSGISFGQALIGMKIAEGEKSCVLQYL